VPIVFAIALLIFFIGLVRFIAYSDSEIERKRGQQVMVWGVVTLFIMSSIWGIIAFIGKNLLIDQGGTTRSPQVELPSLNP
jgi:O-antigen/teichoic acid export membrane protein